MSVPENIRYLRMKAGITQKDLAGRLGINRSTLSRIESGEVDVNQKRLREIDDVLDTTPESLLLSTELCSLIDVAKGAKPDDIRLVTEILKRMKI